MVDLELIKHILKYELRWKKQGFIILTIFPIIVFTIMLFLGETSKDLPGVFIAFGAILPSLGGAFSSVFSPNREGMTLSQKQVASFFSWNYLQSVISDKVSFIVSILSLTLLGVLPASLFYICFIFTLDYNPAFLGYLLPSIALLSLLSLSNWISSIQTPRRLYRKVDKNSPFIERLITDLYSCFFFCIHYGSLFGAGFLLITFFLPNGLIFAILAGTAYLIFLNILAFKYLLKIWNDERYLNWVPSRDNKKTIFYFLACLILAFGHQHFHGFVLESHEDSFYELIENNELTKIKENPYKGNKLNTYRTKEGFSFIHEAVIRNNSEIVDILINNGANIESRVTKPSKKRDHYRENMTPLMIATYWGHEDLAISFIDKGADIEAMNIFGMSVFSLAIFKCLPRVMKKLVESNVNINHQSEKGFSPYFYAAQGRCYAGIKFLKSIKADETLTDKEGLDYLEYAKRNEPLFYRQLSFLNELEQ